VNVVRLPSSDIRDRYGSEREAGAPSADIIKVAAPAIILDNPQWFVELDEELVPNLAEVDPKFVAEKYSGLYSGPFVWTYNTDLVDEPPVDICTLDDIAADYNGGVRLAAPGPGGGWDSWAIVREACGDDFLRNIGALVASGDISFYDSSATAVQEVGAGAAAMNAWGQPEHSRELREAGAPVDFAFLENPVWGLAFYGAISEGTTSPNAARVYLNWLYTREGVEASCAGTYFTFAYDDIEDCPPSPADLQLEDPAVGAAQGPEIDELLGR
jgi:ABC-type Fe3+ transport system substrate-binding protein